MSDVILHHYPESPFAEKIRLVLGFKQLRYRSVTIPMMLPKPDVVALTGGNRRTPIVQIGADVYCDSALIARVLDRLAPTPSLYPPAHAATADLLASWADQHWFAAGVGYAMQPEGFKSMFGRHPPEVVAAFVEDRKAFRKGMPRMGLQAATALLTSRLQAAEAQFADGRAYLLGSTPTIADFSFYHPLWFVRQATAVAGFLDAFGGTTAWMTRMAAIGHGQSTPLGSAEAIDIAQSSVPAPLDGTSGASAGPCPIGARVAVSPSDYGIDPVAGDLMAESADEWVVRRVDPRAGTLHVHFPRFGYQIESL